MSPAAAILVADFWVVRRTKWNIPDLYSEDGIYWFWNGLNWRAFTAYFLGMVWAIPGFVTACGGPAVSDGWYHMYQISFFFGYFVSGGLHIAFNLLFPPPGLGVQVNFELSEDRVIVGMPQRTDFDAADGEDEKRVAEAAISAEKV